MADRLKSKHKVVVFGSEYLIHGEADERYLKRLAEYVDRKMQEVSTALKTVTTANVAVLAAINIADELLQLREQHQKLQDEVEKRLGIMSEIIGNSEQGNKI